MPRKPGLSFQLSEKEFLSMKKIFKNVIEHFAAFGERIGEWNSVI